MRARCVRCNDACRTGGSALADAKAIAGVRGVIARQCPCAAFGATNGLATVPGDYIPFAGSIGTCAAPKCDGTTPRIVDPATPNPAFPTFGDVSGGFEVVMAEGFAHVDAVTAEDDANNPIPAALVAFVMRNTQ